MIQPSLAGLTQLVLQVHRELEQSGSSDLPRYLAASDLHGNHDRLEEILAAARRDEVAAVFLVGDLYSGSHGWSVYRTLRKWVGAEGKLVAAEGTPQVVPLWGNHELAFVAGMLGNDKQLRFSYGFGGRRLIAEVNVELAAEGLPPLIAGGRESPTAEDLAEIRACPPLREMMSWIQSTHRLFVTDAYGTGYLHASPRITRGGQLEIQYQTQRGAEALELLERDLAAATTSKHPVFSALLQTDISPLWSMHEISSARQFDQAYHPLGVRQLVFGHRHRKDPVNVAGVNRQICIAVDFDEGFGGYLRIGPEGLLFRRFVDRHSQRCVETQLLTSSDAAAAGRTHLLDVEEFLVGRLISAEKAFFTELSPTSNHNRREFAQLEILREKGFAWIPRLYAEVYPLVKDIGVRKAMFSIVVDSCDDEAFRSLIHLLHDKTRQLQACGGDWYSPGYVEAKALVQVLLDALRQMPVRRLGLLDVSLRGTTSRVNLLELYQRVMELQDPDLAVMAIENLAALNDWNAYQEVRRAFFHDARRVRVRAAQALASRGEVVYPLVKTLLRSHDNWVRFLTQWTIGQLGEVSPLLAQQASADLRQFLAGEPDWLIYTVGKELLRKLGDPAAEELPERLEIPELTAEIIATLQGIVDAQREPFRRAFQVYYITIVISSLVYRRGLVGLDLDELRIYVNQPDYFPPHFRFYKSAARDEHGGWQGWRRLWIRGETFGRPDGPEIIKLDKNSSAQLPPLGPQTVILYDHRHSGGRVALPELQDVLARFGPGKAKDRIRDAMLRHWLDLSPAQRSMMCRLHAAAATNMLFDLPGEITVRSDELTQLRELADPHLDGLAPLPKPLLSCDPSPGDPSVALSTADREPAGFRRIIVKANWLDANKYPVTVHVVDRRTEPSAAQDTPRD
jgi:hypothetical protein